MCTKLILMAINPLHKNQLKSFGMTTYFKIVHALIALDEYLAKYNIWGMHCVCDHACSRYFH